MKTVGTIRTTGEKIEHWADQHHPMWIEYVRITLGIVLIIKGISFIINKDEVIQMITSSDYWVVHYIIAHYVIGGYIVCGAALIIGLFTRIVVVFEIPALLGSIIFFDLHKNLFAINSEMAYSIIILALLLFFLFYGPGKISMDYYIQNHKDKNYDIS